MLKLARKVTIGVSEFRSAAHFIGTPRLFADG
jgi:hypothetical protein